jgi:hypothetical protein
MPTFNNILRGGRSVSGNSEAPRSRRGNQTAQVDTYWSGLSGRSGADGFGGTGVLQTTVNGVAYFYTSFLSTGSFTVTSAGIFEIYGFGGGGGGSGGNGYNAFGGGGLGGGNTTLTRLLSTGSYTITIGAGGAGATAPTNYASSAGTASLFVGDTVGSGGAGGVNGANNNNNGAAGIDVSAFIGGGSLFKGAGGGNASSGLGGSGIGGNGAAGTATAGSAAANTASGGGGSAGSGQPLLQCGNAGVGGSGIVYIRWRV